MTFVETQDRYATAAHAADRYPAIEIRDAVKTFGSVVAVDGVSLSIQPGEIVALLGPNGAGKTTTIDILLGLSRPTRGAVSVYGMSPRAAVARGLVSAVMQTGGLLKDYTVAETVRLTASLFASGRPVEELLDRAGIADIANRRVGACSGGQQQRLRFAMALAPNPDLLILDEPTTGMDVEGRRDFWAAIRADAAAGRTVVFATHYLAEADEHADRIVFIRKGQVVADGTPSQIKSLGSGRTVRATLAGASSRDLTGIPGASSVEVRGDTLIVQAHDSDAVARHLLTTTTARDLEITSRNIEDAFIALTIDDDTEATDR
ncbi:MAG TPA: ABC transporter ATP-binding protein [Micromonosporaceae bacterium]